MSRKLIDGDRLKKEIHENDIMGGLNYAWYIDHAELVDAVEVKHGEWIIDGMNEYELSYGCVGYEPVYRCSKCGHVTESYLRLDRPIMPEDADFPNYCPNCGAKMDGEVKEDALDS